MDEKLIIEGKPIKLPKAILIIAVGSIVLALFLFFINIGSFRGKKGYYIKDLFDILEFDGYDLFGYIVPIMLYFGTALLFFCLFYYAAFHRISITVTNKRVYGTASWGKRVDLPIDKISAVATSFGHGIAVATSAGSIRFKKIKNNAEVHDAISKLLLERQEQSPSGPEQNPPTVSSQSNADELKKYKELLDSGVITQEEFNAKKKQLLGI